MNERTRPRLFAGLSRDSWLLALASLFSDVSTEMLYPILPVYLTQTLGAGGLTVGLIEGLAQGAQNLIQGVSGTLSAPPREVSALREPEPPSETTASPCSSDRSSCSSCWCSLMRPR